MGSSAKISLISFWVLIFLAIILWYRNLAYDRLLSIIIALFSLSQLIEYGIHSGSHTQGLATLNYVILWFEILVLSVGVYIYLNSTVSLIIMIFFIIVFIAALFNAFMNQHEFAAIIPTEHTGARNDSIIWLNGNKGLLGNWTWLYILGFAIGLALLVFYSSSTSFSSNSVMWITAIIFLYFLLATCLIYTYEKDVSGVLGLSCYGAIGFAFVVYISGVLT